MHQTPSALSFWEKNSFINYADFLIIGSGIVGLSTAIYILERNPNKKVTVLERGILPSGASTKNAGFACIGSPSELLADLSENSVDHVFQTVERRWKGLLNLRALLGDKAIDYLSLGSYELFDDSQKLSFEKCNDNLDFLNRELATITGMNKVFVEDHTIIRRNGFKKFNKAISHAAEGQLDTGKMMQALLSKAHQKGVNVLNGIEVLEIQENRVATNLGEFKFEKLAICTNGFAQKFLPDDDIVPARAQVLITKPLKTIRFKGIYHFDEGYYYFRNIGNRILFGGGRNLDKSGETTTVLGNTELIVDQLKRILKEKITPETKAEVDYTWSGIMGVGNAKSPIVKQVSNSIYCGVRLGGMGVAIGTLVGKELAELMHS